ncbi:hypothetical protein [Halomonas cerina]|uniref:Secreted protein n=1 Tax=Halomonas cerina TaxID=447424 RepID=A0A839VA05_9GAMM|nr:hypothetical protein [Halomonas cerina]MBB3189534.1 hypothetical protein [Halomonas cerina]
MKTRILILATITLLLSAGPLIAMDSAYQKKHHQELQSESGRSVNQEASIIMRDRDRDPRELHLPEGDDWEQTREILRYWWH